MLSASAVVFPQVHRVFTGSAVPVPLLGRSQSGSTKSSTDAAEAPGTPAKPSGAASFFPETAYLADKSAETRRRIAADWETFHEGGFGHARVVEFPNMGRWPSTGDYDEITRLLASQLDLKATPVRYAETTENGHSLAVREGQEEVAARSLQHLVAFLEARKARAPALIVADHRSSISSLGEGFAFSSHSGRPEEFDSFVLSFLYKGPKKWDVLFCDKGLDRMTAGGGKKPLLSFTNHKWVGRYEVYNWKAENAEVAGLYMVSESFLQRLPALMKDAPFTAIDGWLASVCKTREILCLSYLQVVDDAKLAAKDAQAAKLAKDAKEAGKLGIEPKTLPPPWEGLSWRDTVVVNPSKVLGKSVAANLLSGTFGVASGDGEGAAGSGGDLRLPALGGLLVGGDAGDKLKTAKELTSEDLFAEDVDVNAFDAAASAAAGEEPPEADAEDVLGASSSADEEAAEEDGWSAADFDKSVRSSARRKSDEDPFEAENEEVEGEEEVVDQRPVQKRSKKSAKEENAGADAMLDWWSEEDAAADEAEFEDEVEAEEERVKRTPRAHSKKTKRRQENMADIEASPVLDRSDPREYESARQSKLRRASKRAAEEQAQMIERAEQLAESDAAAERSAKAGSRRSKGKAKGIILETLPAEHAWKYVSMIHHRDEVAAANSAAARKSARDEEEEREAYEGEYEDEYDPDEAEMAEIEEDMEEERALDERRPRVGRRESRVRGRVREEPARASRSRRGHWASGVGKLGRPVRRRRDRMVPTGRPVGLTAEEVRAEVDAELRRAAKEQVRRMVSNNFGGRRFARDGRRYDERPMHQQREVQRAPLKELQRAPLKPNPPLKAADHEWRAGGAWRSAFSWLQNPSSYGKKKQEVFDSEVPGGDIARQGGEALRLAGAGGDIARYPRRPEPRLGGSENGFGDGMDPRYGSSTDARQQPVPRLGRVHTHSSLGDGDVDDAYEDQDQAYDDAPGPGTDPEEFPKTGLGAVDWKDMDDAMSMDDAYLDDFGPGAEQLRDR